ncbi:IS3 family transposase [Glycomyces halotolerans]
MTEQLEVPHERHKSRYGLRRLDAMLRREDRRHSRRRLRRLTRSAGIECLHPKARANRAGKVGCRLSGAAWLRSFGGDEEVGGRSGSCLRVAGW